MALCAPTYTQAQRFSVQPTTSLMLACLNGSLDNESDDWMESRNVYAQDSYGRTPLMYALMGNKLHIVRQLLARKPTAAQMNMATVDGKTALIVAVTEADAAIIPDLVSHGAHVDSYDIRGCTALAHAVQQGREDCVAELLRCGANPNLPHPTGCTPLVSAVRMMQIQTARLLVQAGARVNIPQSRGSSTSLLHVASRNGDSAMVCLLLVHGANPDGCFLEAVHVGRELQGRMCFTG